MKTQVINSEMIAASPDMLDELIQIHTELRTWIWWAEGNEMMSDNQINKDEFLMQAARFRNTADRIEALVEKVTGDDK